MNLSQKQDNGLTKEYIDRNLKQLYTATQRNLNQAIEEIKQTIQPQKPDTTDINAFNHVTETLKQTHETIKKIEQEIEQIKNSYVPTTRFEKLKDILNKELNQIQSDLSRIGVPSTPQKSQKEE